MPKLPLLLGCCRRHTVVLTTLYFVNGVFEGFIGFGISNMALISCYDCFTEIAHHEHDLVNYFRRQPGLRGYI